MESLIDSIGAFLSALFGLAQGGFDGVNQVTGLLIAVIAALVMPAWNRLWASALGAAIAHVVIDTMRPVLDGGAFVLPPLLTMTFWMTLLGLFFGYGIVIALFFLIKSLVTGLGKAGHKQQKHAH
jgi:hypothetical protein